MTAQDLFILIDLISVAVFAVSGALAGARKGLDIIGLVWLGTITGIGGGTMRDLLLDRPVFWINDTRYLIIACVSAALVFAVVRLPRAWDRLLLWLDALGLAFVAVAGTAKALTFGAPASVAILMGVITASLGGILRDVLVQEPSILMRKEIYVTAALLGASVYVIADAMRASSTTSAALGICAGFALRAGAIHFGWHLPGARLGQAAKDHDCGAE
jgi:uncharacterized membrane protein YeiH